MLCGKAGDNSRGIAAFLCVEFKECFAVAESCANLVVAAKRIPDEKACDENENESEKNDGSRDRRNSVREQG
jgi:hypothetical protein